MNPVMAFRMKENAVFGALRTTHHAGNAVVKAPARDPSDFRIAHSAESALFMPEKAKRASTPKRFLHMGSFAFLEVGLPSTNRIRPVSQERACAGFPRRLYPPGRSPATS